MRTRQRGWKLMSELNKSIIKIRVDLQNSDIKKSGKNMFGKGFSYFELADFLPRLNELMLENDINDLFTIEKEIASLKIFKDKEVNEYQMPFIISKTPNGMQPIQHLGALNTYYKRYLYLNAFGITDGEVIDSMDNNDIPNNKPDKKPDKKPNNNLPQNVTKQDFANYINGKCGENSSLFKKTIQYTMEHLGKAKFEDAMPLKHDKMVMAVDVGLKKARSEEPKKEGNRI